MKMHRYRSTHKSGVLAYVIRKTSILILFPPDREGVKYVYEYGYKSPGKEHVEQMKSLAPNGAELATYINQYVREKYQKKTPVDEVILVD